MKQLLYLPIFILFSMQFAIAQNYMDYMEQGKYYFNKQNYISAIQRFDLAYESAESEISKKDALKWKDNSFSNLKDYQSKIEKKLSTNETELAYARQLINAFYFYDDKIALAYKDGKYGYIHKNGQMIIPCKYDYASDFEQSTGFAKVKRNQDYYLIDTTGKEYLLATNGHVLNGITEALDLRDQSLAELPSELFNHPSLKILIVSNNRLTNLPAALTRLKELIYLDASNNKILSLPDEIGELKHLKILNLQNNSISKVPNGFTLLTELQSLNLSNNKLFSMPNNMSSLYLLSELILDGNSITKLPADIGHLRNLKLLSLKNNSIQKLPESIATLYQLKKLYLNQNSITDLPAEIGRLVDLEYLCLSRNQLGYLPIEIKQLANLKSIDLQSNPIPQQKKPLIEGWLPNCAVLF